MRNQKIHRLLCQGASEHEPRRLNHRGQGLVEMALITPVLILSLMGIVEMGRLFYAWATIQQATRAGTRAAITGRGEQNGTRLKLIIDTTRKWTDNLPGQRAAITVRSWPNETATGPSWENDPGQPCGLVEVEVQYVYQPLVSLIGSLMENDGQVLLEGRDRKINEPWVPCPQYDEVNE